MSDDGLHRWNLVLDNDMMNTPIHILISLGNKNNMMNFTCKTVTPSTPEVSNRVNAFDILMQGSKNLGRCSLPLKR